MYNAIEKPIYSKCVLIPTSFCEYKTTKLIEKMINEGIINRNQSLKIYNLKQFINDLENSFFISYLRQIAISKQKLDDFEKGVMDE